MLYSGSNLEVSTFCLFSFPSAYALKLERLSSESFQIWTLESYFSSDSISFLTKLVEADAKISFVIGFWAKTFQPLTWSERSSDTEAITLTLFLSLISRILRSGYGYSLLEITNFLPWSSSLFRYNISVI